MECYFDLLENPMRAGNLKKIQTNCLIEFVYLSFIGEYREKDQRGTKSNFLDSLELETFRYLNPVLLNFDSRKSFCLTFISKKFKRQTKQMFFSAHLAFCVEV